MSMNCREPGRTATAAKGGNKSLKGGTSGSKERIPTVLCESRSLNFEEPTLLRD